MGQKQLIENAETRCESKYSLRSYKLIYAQITISVILFIIIAGLVSDQKWVLHGLIAMFTIFILGNGFVKANALHLLLTDRRKGVRMPSNDMPKEGWPSYSILVPLYKEHEVLPKLVKNLSAMDYPKDKLDIKLLIEVDDIDTLDALKSVKLPSHITVLPIPSSPLRTKPKAMNFALPFCRGDIVGIYDAEDKPEIDQLKHVANGLATTRGKNVVCVQCELDYFNARQNWLTRCFTMEYRVWFAAVLPIVGKLKMAIPLGGTSVFIKRSILEEVGAWDSHNVTKDADLGVRLKRLGYNTMVIKSRTSEEANGRTVSLGETALTLAQGLFIDVDDPYAQSNSSMEGPWIYGISRSANTVSWISHEFPCNPAYVVIVACILWI